MVDKNPYEKDEVEVPNFGDSEDKGSDPIFNMDTTSVDPETESFDAEEEAESSSKVAIVVLIVFLVLFLVGTISGWIFGISNSKKVSTLQEEYDAYKVKMNDQIAELNTRITTLQAENDSLKATQNEQTSSSSEGSKAEASEHYSITDGVTVRSGAGTSFAVVNYDKLPNAIKDLVLYDKATNSVTTRNTKFPVYETKDADGHKWGRIADGAWVCIDSNLATKQ